MKTDRIALDTSSLDSLLAGGEGFHASVDLHRAIESIRADASGCRVGWASVPGQIYRVEHSPNLAAWASLPDSVVTTPAREALLHYVDTAHTNARRGYYRIGIVPR